MSLQNVVGSLQIDEKQYHAKQIRCHFGHNQLVLGFISSYIDKFSDNLKYEVIRGRFNYFLFRFPK